MKKILFVVIFFLTGCKLYSFIYGVEMPPKNEEFEYYDKKFEINNVSFLEKTNLKFDGFYFQKTYYDKNSDLKIKKFFKNGLITEATYLRGTTLDYVTEDMNKKQFYFGFIKFVGNDALDYELKANHMNKKKSGIKGKYLIFEDYLLHIVDKDSIKYDFYPSLKSAIYSAEY